MTESKRGPMPSQDSPEHITVFEVDAYGTLRIANFTEPVTREDFYDELITGWSRSPKDLAAALEVCRPLVSEVYSICAETANSAQVASEEIDEERERSEAQSWLLRLSKIEFEEAVLPRLSRWFAEPPSWDYEDEHLPSTRTGQGIALDFFQDLPEDVLDLLGVEVVEGEHPGSSYFAARLIGTVDEANRAAEAAEIRMRIVNAES